MERTTPSHANDQRIIDLLHQWQHVSADQSPRTVHQEVIDGHTVGLNEMMGYAKLTRQLSPLSLNIRFAKWTGMDADRSAILPMSQTYTIGMNQRNMARTYLALFTDSSSPALSKLRQMRHPRGQSERLHTPPIEIGLAILAQTNDASKTPALKRALQLIPEILHSLKDLEETARDITGISKALAAIPILEYAQTNNVTTVAKTPPHIRRYFDQFYNNQFEKVRPFFNHMSAKMGISTDKQLAHIRIQLEEKISELLAKDPAPILKQRFQQLQNALQELAADPTIDKSNVHLDDLVKDSEDISAIFSAFGTHYKTCQSRLPAEWVGEAAKDVLAIELGAKVPEATSEAALIRRLVDRMMQNPNERIDSDLLSANKTSQMVVDFFKMTRIANKTFPHINWQIMANYTSPVEFLGAYYLALRTGAITIENGNVTSSSIRIMELSESAAQVANYFKTVGHIHTVPIMRQLTQQSLGHFGPEFGTKIATSDTTRDIGQLLGQSTIALHKEYAAILYDRLYKADWETSAGFMKSPYGIFDENPEIVAQYHHVLDGKLAASATGNPPVVATPKPKFYYQVGQGSHRNRWNGTFNIPQSTGDSGFTYQPGRRENDSASPDRAVRLLRQSILNANLPQTPQLAHAEWAFKFSEPGGLAYREFVKQDGPYNRLLIQEALTYAIVNAQKFGSRTAPEKSLEGMHIVDDNRAITVSGIMNQTGFQAGAVIPLVSSYRHWVSSESNGLATLRHHYATNPVFRNLILSSEGVIAHSTTEGLRLWMTPNNSAHHALITECDAQQKQSEEIICLIKEQTAITSQPKDRIERQFSRVGRLLDRAAYDEGHKPNSLWFSKVSPGFFTREGRARYSTLAHTKQSLDTPRTPLAEFAIQTINVLKTVAKGIK